MKQIIQDIKKGHTILEDVPCPKVTCNTILIKTSFSAEGLVSNALIIGSVLFGLLILVIHNFYEKNTAYFSRKY